MSLTTEQIRSIGSRAAERIAVQRGEFNKSIQAAIKDEENAIVEYTHLSEQADYLNEHKASIDLGLIAADEARHKETLQEIAEGKVVEETKPVEEKKEEPAPEEEECHCDTLKPMEEWLSEEDTEEQCHECILTPIADFYLGALNDAKAEPQIKQLNEAWATADLTLIGKAMDKIKNEVGESLKKRLINFDCIAQTYKPEAAEDNKQHEE